MIDTNEINMNNKSIFEVKLDCFEGPLDLLLHLIKDAKLDITTIKLSEITDGYLKYMEQIPSLDLEKASDFIEIAATLIEIKSKKLLPKCEEQMLQDEEDPEQKLIRQIQEYKLFKDTSEKLKSIEELNRFYKKPDKDCNKIKIQLKDMQFQSLVDAFANILAKTLEKKENVDEKHIVKDRFTVAEKIAAIKDAVLFNKTILFTQLVDIDQTKSEIINIFLALLELLKQQIVKAKQVSNFADIEITKNEEE